MNQLLFEVTARTIGSSETYPGYPTERLVMDPADIPLDGVIDLPDGPWAAGHNPLPSPEESKRFVDAGYRVDSLGRPLHPWLKEMITDPNVGVVINKGKYWNWGPNYTADPVVITNEERRQILLIKRGDTGVWALPGGFVDGNENPLDSARRELHEEAGYELDAPATLLYRGVVADLRTTAHAWAETSAYRFVVDEPFPVMAGDDAKEAKWFYEDELPEKLHGSHEILIQMALAERPKRSIRDILQQPADVLKKTVIDAGHMAYDHFFLQDDHDRLFVKAHDASRFTDPLREAHSREYLQKEFALYQHLNEHGFSAIPRRVDLVDDSLLAMDAFYPLDGWKWNAPTGREFKQYTDDIITALSDLQSTPLPDHPAYHDGIEATYPTFWQEGWDDIADKTDLVVDKIRQLSSDWTDEQKVAAETLINDLPNLVRETLTLDRDSELFLAHNDARQSNIAWHPEKGVRIVDWSWGDPAPKNADATMFLIDLAKAGHDVSEYSQYINKDFLVTQIGFLLGHSLWQTRDSDQTVRIHQVASAIAAHQLYLKS